jgi:uncharacterized protein with GYD domain
LGGENVQKYIVLGKWTDQGRKTLNEISKRIETARNLLKQYNANLTLCYTMGEYDFIGIVDIPDEESMVKIILKLNSMQNFKTTTLRAWTDTEFMELIKEL